jgi:dTDP-4-amino-4,6-dideoxygalactose transaminase
MLENLAAKGTGATGSYPTPLNELPKLKEVLADNREYKNAKQISASIVTLPVHSGVSATDREKIKRIVRQVSHAN